MTLDSETLQALAVVAGALTPVMLAIIAVYAARENNQSKDRLEDVRKEARKTSLRTDAKLDQIHVLVNDNLTKAKSAELAALEAWALTLEAHPDHDPRALGKLRERIAALRLEIAERDEVAANL
jgi:hypothetical protein